MGGLLLADSLGGASACACAAAHALLSVDYVVALALGDSLNRTLASACAARDAFITNLVSHNSIVFLNYSCHLAGSKRMVALWFLVVAKIVRFCKLYIPK